MAEPNPTPQGYVAPITAPGPKFEPGVPSSSSEYGDAFRPNAEQVWQETVNLNSLNSLIGIPGRSEYEGAGIRLFSELQHVFSDEKKYGPDELNKMFPDLPEGQRFEGKMPLSVAMQRVDNLRKQDEMKAWIARGAPLTPYHSFTAGAMTGLDPANIATGMLFGGERIGAKVLGNIAGNLLVDVPTTAAERMMQQDVNYSETIKNSIYGGIIGTGVGEAIGKSIRLGAKGIGKGMSLVREQVGKMPYFEKQRALSIAAAQVESGAKIDVSPVVSAALRRANGEFAQGVEGSKVFTRVEHPSEQAVYSATHPDTGDGVVLGEDYGGGKYYTSDSQHAVNMAANPDGVTTGKVSSHQIGEDAKVLNLDIPASEPKAASLLQALANKLGVELSGDTAFTVKDELDFIYEMASIDRKGVNEQLSLVAKEQGLDGFHWVENSPSGDKNVSMLFDETKAPAIADVPVDKASAPRIAANDAEVIAQKMDAPESNYHYSEEAVKKIEEVSAKDYSNLSEYDKAVEDILSQEKTILEDPNLSPEDVAIIDEANADYKTAMKDRSVLKMLGECIIKSIT